jgi:hypothetical protein
MLTLGTLRPGERKTPSTKNSPSSRRVFLIFISNPLWRNIEPRNTVVPETPTATGYEDAQINKLKILSTFVKQRTYPQLGRK